MLCQAIERPLIRLRPLGRSDITEIENRATLFTTGNQLRVRGDMVRRTLICDLDANMERPETREFRSDPVADVIGDRGRYVSACLMVVRAYLEAGSPGKLKPIASFEDWSNVVRSALVWLGCDDPAASMEAARADDPELTELREITAAWSEALGCDGVTVAEVAATAGQYKAGTQNPEFPGLREVLHRSFGERGTINTNRLARWLRAREGRIVNGRKIAKTGLAQGGVVRWAVIPAPSGH